MITRIRRLVGRVVAPLIVLLTFGLVRVKWAGTTAEQARERESREAVLVVDEVSVPAGAPTEPSEGGSLDA